MTEDLRDEGLLDVSAVSGFERRRFLRNAAIAGVTAAWSAPLVQTVAYATGGHHNPPASPFTPGECPRTETRTRTNTTPKTHDKTDTKSKSKSNSGHGNSHSDHGKSNSGKGNSNSEKSWD